MTNDYRTKLSQQLDRLYIATGSFGSNTLVAAPTPVVTEDYQQIHVPTNAGECSFVFAHDHVVVQFSVNQYNVQAGTFQLSTVVYRMPAATTADSSDYFATLHELLMECRKGLVMGHVNWSAQQDLTVQLDLPIAFLEASQYKEFELSMKSFMASYWKVRSNLSQYFAGKQPNDNQLLPATATLSDELLLQGGGPRGRGAALQLLKRSKKKGRSFRVIRRILPTSKSHHDDIMLR